MTTVESDHLRRSYTLIYLLSIDLALAVIGVTSLTLPSPFSFSLVGLITAVTLLGGLRAHQLWLTGRAFSRRELILWTLLGAGIPALIFAVAFLLAAALGADLA